MLYVAHSAAIYRVAGGSSNVRFDGLQIGVSASNSNYQSPVFNDYANVDNSAWWFSNCIFRGAGSADYNNPGVYVADSQNTVTIWDCIIYNVGTRDNAYCSGVICDSGTANLYSSTVIGGKYGVCANGGTINAKNVYAGGTLTEDFYRGSGTLAKTNCASEDASADDTGTGETATNCVAAAVAIDTDTFVNVTATTEDFHLAADGNSPLEDAGVDTSGEGAPLNFTTDIDGDTITTWPIGADFRYVAAPSGMTNDIVMIFEC
jgi:hypothetical protein